MNKMCFSFHLTIWTDSSIQETAMSAERKSFLFDKDDNDTDMLEVS